LFAYSKPLRNLPFVFSFLEGWQNLSGALCDFAGGDPVCVTCTMIMSSCYRADGVPIPTIYRKDSGPNPNILILGRTAILHVVRQIGSTGSE